MPRRSREFIITLTAYPVHRVHRGTRVGIRDGGRSLPRGDRSRSILHKYLNYESCTRDKTNTRSNGIIEEREEKMRKRERERMWMKKRSERKGDGLFACTSRISRLGIRIPKIARLGQTTKRRFISVISFGYFYLRSFLGSKKGG